MEEEERLGNFSEMAVVIPTHQRPELLLRTLESLEQCGLPEGFRETIVVENGRKHELVETIVGRFSSSLRARYMYVALGNKSYALNLALAGLDDNVLVFFTDDDVRFGTDVLRAYSRAAANAGEHTFFGGPFDADWEVAPPAFMHMALPRSAVGWRPSSDNPDSFFLGFNWAAYVRDLRNAGGFDRRFGPGSVTGAEGQETIMQLRLMEQGVRKRYVPDACVWHFVPRERCSLRWLLRRSRRRGRAWMLTGPSMGFSEEDYLPLTYTGRQFLRVLKYAALRDAERLVDAFNKLYRGVYLVQRRGLWPGE